MDEQTRSSPVSFALEQDVLGDLRKHGIVVWLDKDASYTSFVDRLVARQANGDFPFPVVAFRGSFLEVLFKLETYGNAPDVQPLLIHLPGFTEQSVRSTPVLELYEAGHRFRKLLDTLIREVATSRVAPADVERFVAEQPSLEAADAWLASSVSHRTFGLAAALDEFGPSMLVDALAEPSTLAPRIKAAEELTTLGSYLHRLTGMDEAWESAFYTDITASPLERTLHRLGSWVLAVEYVHDLRRPPHDARLRRLKGLSPPIVKACCDLTTRFRDRHGDAYARVADEVEELLKDELGAMSPDDLGQIDTFRGEEKCILEGAVAALRHGQWAKAKDFCEARQGERSFWLQRNQLRRWEWNLVAEAAVFGATLARHTGALTGTRSLDEAANRYAQDVYEVDLAHRRFEQRRLALMETRMEHYGALREVTTELRKAHRAWADQLTRAFSALCRDQGFLPSPQYRQRNLFEQVVHPLTLGSEKVAVFVIDAFRFEMAAELVEELRGAGTVVDLRPRLAELPTITSVGMNVLAPVSQSEKLAVAGIFQGFKTGEFTVRDPETRARAMGLRSVGKQALFLPLGDVCQASTTTLTKDLKPHTLIVVHSKDIDDAGEANVGLPTFESTLRQIKVAWHHLQLAGVKNFVFTADHGFLLQDETTDVRAFGKKTDPQRRHVFDEHARAEAGMVNVSVSSLGYEGLNGYLLFRDDTAVFATGTSGATFVHGGNSLQERVIPVLTVTRERAELTGYAAYEVEVEAMPDVVGLHRIKVRVVFAKHTTTSLGFAAARAVDLSLRVLSREAVRVLFKDVSGPGAIKTGRLEVPVTETWTEVFFGLEGPTDDRVRVEVHHPDGVEKVTGATPEAWFSVIGTTVGNLSTSSKTSKPSSRPPPAHEHVVVSAQTASSAVSPTPSPSSSHWADSITDEGVRKVFLHIEKHGAMTEPEVTNLLGSPRAFRRFSLELEQHLPKLPFRVRIEAAEGGKRYVREGDR